MELREPREELLDYVHTTSSSGSRQRPKYDKGAQHPLGTVCLAPLLWGSDQRQQFGEYRANPQYRKTRRAKGLGTPACAQSACMTEQESKVLKRERVEDAVITLF